MSKKILTIKYFNGGIGDSEKEGVRGACYLSNNLDVVSEPTYLTLNPATAKDSGTVVVDLVKWIVSASPSNTNTYFYGDAGYIYSRTSAGTWTMLQKTANSHGQGMELYDDYLYYAQDTQIGRYGPLSTTPAFDDDWQTALDNTSAAGLRIAPIKSFAAGFAIGHGNNLGWWDGTVWDVDRLNFPTGYNVRSLDVLDEYLVIGTWKGSSVTDSEDGIVFFWDGTATTYNFFTPIPEGGVQAVLNSRNRLLTLAGAEGTLYINYSPFQKIHKIPYVGLSKYVEVLPGAVTNWRGISLIGVAGNTDSTTLTQGVYMWGSKSDKYNEILSLLYAPSHGKVNLTTSHIGALKGIGSTLFVSWQDNVAWTITGIVFSNSSADIVMGTKIAHGLNTGNIITVTGCTQAYANASWTVTKVTDNTFTLDSASWASFNGADVTGDASIASTYGVDKLVLSASPFTSGTFQSLIFDDNRPLQEKMAITLKATHKALAANESVQLGYKSDRASSYTTGTANSTTGSTMTRLNIPTTDARFYEFQFECILATSGSTAPTVTSLGMEYDNLEEETLV
jgi:hypothetical protein